MQAELSEYHLALKARNGDRKALASLIDLTRDLNPPLVRRFAAAAKWASNRTVAMSVQQGKSEIEPVKTPHSLLQFLRHH